MICIYILAQGGAGLKINVDLTLPKGINHFGMVLGTAIDYITLRNSTDFS